MLVTIAQTGIAVLSAPLQGHAEPLPREACDLLGSELDKLVSSGVKGWMAQGANDARSRLGPDQLSQIARFLEIDEQLLFRCGLYKVRFVLPPDAEEAATEAPTPTPAAKPAAPVRDKTRPKAKAGSEPDRKAAEQASSVPSPVKDSVAAKTPPRKKAKPEDAYRPAPLPGID